MVKAEIIEEPQVSQETELFKVDNVPDVDVAMNNGTLIKNSVKGY